MDEVNTVLIEKKVYILCKAESERAVELHQKVVMGAGMKSMYGFCLQYCLV